MSNYITNHCRLQVAPSTIHPLHDKAAQYFGVRIVKVPVGEDCKPDLQEYEKVSVRQGYYIVTALCW